jgi:antitoxin HicB
MGLPYTRELIPEPEGGWFIRVKELPGCMSQGDTVEEAIEMISDAMEAWLSSELRAGAKIPEPREEEEYSGKFLVRVPKSLHKKISEASEYDGVSLNQWIGTTLAEAVGERRSIMTDSKTEVESFAPNFKFAMESILSELSTSRNVKADESTIADWFDRSLEDLRNELNKDRDEKDKQLSQKLDSLLSCLEPYQNQSSLISTFIKFIRLLKDLSESVVAMADKQNQIRAIIQGINQPTINQIKSSKGVSISERERTLSNRLIREFGVSYSVE